MTQRRSITINRWFIPAAVFVAIRAYLQEGLIYALVVVAAGLTIGLAANRYQSWRDRHATGDRG